MSNSIKIFQNLKSNEHEDAMFYSGIIAVATNKVNGKLFCLYAKQAEIVYYNIEYIGEQISDLAAFNVICDTDIDDVETWVDGFIYIAEFNPNTLQIQSMDEVDENLIFNEYSEAIEAFEDFIDA
jgi:hypothetical protein